MRLDRLKGAGHRRAEGDLQPVFSREYDVTNLDLPASEHVVGFQDLYVVQANHRVSVEPFEHQFQVLGPLHLRRQTKDGSVLPIFLLDPLQATLVVPPEGVLDDAVVEKVGVHRPGYGRRPPRVLPGLAKLPAVVERDLLDRGRRRTGKGQGGCGRQDDATQSGRQAG